MGDHFRCENCGKYVKIIEKGSGELSCCGKPMILLSEFKSVDDILDFAIVKEKEAEKFYREWAEKVKDEWIKNVFVSFAGEEHKHMEILVKAKKGETLKTSEQGIQDLKISDYLTDISPSQDMDYQEALIIAMKREKASFKLYSDLAALTKGKGIHETLLALAQEEARHKVRLETIYDDEILSWN
jgi:desulfoferrodoxin-like iron-binding protein